MPPVTHLTPAPAELRRGVRVVPGSCASHRVKIHPQAVLAQGSFVNSCLFVDGSLRPCGQSLGGVTDPRQAEALQDQTAGDL